MHERLARLREKASGSLAVSVVLHVVLGLALIEVFLQPLPLNRFFRYAQVEPTSEHLSYLSMPKTGGATRPERSGGDNHPITKNSPKPLVAPTTVPSALPVAPPPTTQPAAASGGLGPVVGVGGVTQGVRPEYTDPRVWVPPAPVGSGPKSNKERVDSVIASHIQAHNDSMIASAAGFKKPGDWTVTHNGKKYGIDQQYIHLGPISIPTAVLALLPINNVQGNPMEGGDQARYDARHDEIQQQALKGIDEATFRDAVRKERERMEAEHQHEEQEKQKQQQEQEQDQAQTVAKDGGAQ